MQAKKFDVSYHTGDAINQSINQLSYSATYCICDVNLDSTTGRDSGLSQADSSSWKNSFKTKRTGSIFQWVLMRFKEGPTPSVAQKEIESILAEVELSQIYLRSASSADVPRETWIGHATVLVQY